MSELSPLDNHNNDYSTDNHHSNKLLRIWNYLHAVMASISKSTKLLILAVFVILFFVLTCIMSSSLGGTTGDIVGTATGTFYAVTIDIPDGLKAGKEDGLSAEDTTVRIRKDLQSIGKFEIMEAEVKLRDDFHIGTDAQALIFLYGNVIFTVDLMSANIEMPNPTEVIIRLPEPIGELSINEDKTKIADIWQKYSFSGELKDGYIAAINSRKNIAKASAETISGYDSLVLLAKEYAQEQVTRLIQGICGSTVFIEVRFDGGATK